MRQAGPIPIGTSYTLSAAPITGPAPSPPLFFCSYHSQLPVNLPDGTSREVQYVVQPWTAATACDEPGVAVGGSTPDALSESIALALVGPLSAAHIASIVNPGMNGWFALNGSEINDHVLSDPARGIAPVRQAPVSTAAASLTVGSNSYTLQREFNNAAAIETEPFTLGYLLPSQYDGCANGVVLSPHFVVPSPIEQGDEVWLDGSTTSSTLMVPNAGYQWNFGDGHIGSGASVVHVFQQPGNYTVTLNVTDRGGYTATLSQTIQVLLPNGQPYTPPPPAPPQPQVRMQLLPQSLGQVLHQGISAILSSNTPRDGFASVSISRAAAKRAKIKTGRASTVVVGRGTVSGRQERSRLAAPAPVPNDGEQAGSPRAPDADDPPDADQQQPASVWASRSPEATERRAPVTFSADGAAYDHSRGVPRPGPDLHSRGSARRPRARPRRAQS